MLKKLAMPLFFLASLAAGFAPSALAAPTAVLFLGDSLTEGLGVPKEAAFPALVEALLKADGAKDLQIINAGISGSTSASALSRLKWHLKAAVKPQILFLALGANDGLRGLPVKELKTHLVDTVRLAKLNGMTVLLVGMLMPPNYGKEYTEAFAAVYPAVAKEESVALLPFLLEGVALDKKLNQADGIHPNVDGHKIVATTVVKYLKPLLPKT